MKENFEKKTSKSEKSNKIVVVLLCSVLLVFAVFAGLYASGVLQIPTSTPEASEEALQKADNVTDEATLRELLAMDCELNIKVTEDIEIAETLVVNGVKKVTSDKLLKASFKLKDAAAMLDVSKKASLTIDGWNMDGNGVALGVNVNRNATFNHLDGVMEYMGTYGVVTEGVTNLSKETEISHVGEGAFKVAIEGEMNVAGGKFTDGGNYLANVEAGGVLNISGEPLFDGAVNYLVYNYGETTINGGTFLNSGYRGVTNYAKMTMEYNGDKEDGYIEVGNTKNVAVYTYSTFKVSYNGVYGHDAGANVFLQSHKESRCYVENCTFDTSKGNAVSIRGEVHVTGVDIRNAGSSGVILQQNGVATFKDVQIDNSNGRGISVESATLLGEDIRISGTGGVGIAAQVYNGIGPAKVDVSDVHLSNIQGNSIKVINGGVMEFKDSVFEISKRTSVMAENGIIKLHGVKVLGNIDKDVNVVQVQPDGDLTISGKTLITGGVMRAVAVYGGKFTMNGGEIRDNSTNETGAAVHITKKEKSVGVFTMNGGSICNNTTTNEIKNAGGVNVSNDAMFVMKGGKIYGNKTSGIGGGVRVAEGATFKMSGGEIYKNTSKQGGGVQVDKDATFTMTGGSIYQNETKASGAGVHVLGNFAISGGKIYQNKATSYGGAMNIASTTDNKTKKVTAAGVLTMTGGEIYGNSAVSGGGAIQVSGNTTANISGGKITNNETGGIGDGIRVSGKVTISGDCYVGNDKVALTSKDVKLKVTGKKLTQHSAKDPLLVAVADGVSTGHVVVECDDNDAAVSLITHTASGNGSYLLAQKDKNLVVNYAAADMDMTGADTVYVSNFAELKEAITSTTSKRYIILGADIEMESTITVPNGTTVYIRDDGVQRTLSRKEGKTSTFFNTRYGTGIYLVGTKAGNLVLDGAISADAKAANVASLVTAQGGTIVDGVTFKNNGTEENKTLLGAFIYQKYGHLDIYDSTFTGAKAGSGAVGIATMATGYAENCVFADNTVVNGGGAIRLEKNSEFKIRDSVFENNSAGTSGGAVVSESGTFTAIDCDFRNNTAENDGGVIKSNGGTAKFLDEDGKQNVLTANTSGKAGGAIWAKGMLEIEEYAFESNHSGLKKAANGGAIYVEGSSTNATVTNGTFTDNESLSNCGGAMYVNAGTVKLNGTGAFKGNTAVCGGAIYYNTATKSEIGAWDFVENSTTAGNGDIDEHGGAIFVNKGELHLNGQGNFTGNTAYKGGGAINVAAGSMTIKGYTFGGNVATTGDGGAIRNAATLTLEDCDFKKVNDVANQSVAKKGGAIYLTGDGSITLKGTGEFSGNTAYQAGGAIFLNSGTITAEENADYTFDGNSASTGGALYIQKGSFTAANFDFKNNIATGGNCWTGNDFGGGAIVLGQGGTTELTLTGTGEFTNNQALQSTAGGAISVMDARATLNINKDTTAEDYTYTFTGNASQNHGGAIRIVAGTVQIERVNFTTNRTEANCGGAIAASNAVLTIKNAKFDGNYTGGADGVISAKDGGAIYVNHVNADIAINNTLFNNNQASYGGAIRITKDKQIVITDCQFTNNRAHDVAHNNGSGYGGAINMAVSGDTTSVTLNGANSFTGNKAELLGGAIYVSGTTETVGGTSVKYNSELTVNGTTFTENVARGDAGAICASTNAVVTVNDSSFLRNEASYDYTDDTQLSGRNGNGGAIYATSNAQVTLLTQTANTYKFEGNKAVRNATEPKTFGAICANGTSVVTYSEYYVFANDNSDGANGATGDGIGKASDTATITKLATAGDYATLKLAVANAPTGVTTEITLTGNVVIEDTRIDVNSGQDVVVKNAKEISIEISRTEASASNMFNVNAGGKLKFMSNSEGGTISFDGKNVEKASMLYGRGVLELNGIVLKNGKSGNGSAVQLRNNTAQLIANDCTFESNVSTDKGGAITLTTDSGTNTYPTIQIANTKFESNICATNGGAICAEGGTIYLLGQVDFTGNKASGASDVYGGALYLKNVTLTSEPTDAMKQTGFTTSGIVNFTNNNTVTSNSNKNNNGGAIYQTGGTISLMGGGTFTGNKAGANNVNKGAGGAINTMGTVNLKNYDFTQNIAIKDGGAIRVDAATVNVENCNFVSNSAGTSAELTGNGIYNGRGGAIYLSVNDANRLNLTGTGKFESNVYTHDTDGVKKNAIYKSKGTVTGADGYTYVDNANSF